MDTVKQKILLLILFCMGHFLLATAQPSLKTTVDKNAILIGDQIKLRVEASFQWDAYFVRWLTLPDSFEHFELVEKSPIDSIYENEKLTGLAQTFTFTSFDSGKWAAPSFNVKFNHSRGDSTINLFSDSTLQVMVAYQKDTTLALRDIKPIRAVEASNAFWYWVAGGITLLLILAGLWFYYRKKKGKPLIPARLSIGAFRQAMNELDKLQQSGLTDEAAIKWYHSKLAEIFKQYLSSKTGMDYAGKTTGDLLIFLRDNNIDKEQFSKTSAALRSSDVVKFAKYLPETMESKENLQAIKKTIEILEQQNIQQ